MSDEKNQNQSTRAQGTERKGTKDVSSGWESCVN